MYVHTYIGLVTHTFTGVPFYHTLDEGSLKCHLSYGMRMRPCVHSSLYNRDTTGTSISCFVFGVPILEDLNLHSHANARDFKWGKTTVTD